MCREPMLRAHRARHTTIPCLRDRPRLDQQRKRLRQPAVLARQKAKRDVEELVRLPEQQLMPMMPKIVQPNQERRQAWLLLPSVPPRNPVDGLVPAPQDQWEEEWSCQGTGQNLFRIAVCHTHFLRHRNGCAGRTDQRGRTVQRGQRRHAPNRLPAEPAFEKMLEEKRELPEKARLPAVAAQ